MAQLSLKGSDRRVVSGASVVGPADPDERLEVSVILRSRERDALRQRVTNLAQAGRAVSCVSRQQFAAEHGSDPADISAVRDFAGVHGLSVLQEHAARRTVILSGTVAQFSVAFGVSLHRMSHPGGSYRGRQGPVTVPVELQDIVVAVLGLDDRPQAQPHFRIRPTAGNVNWRPAAAGQVSYTPLQLASLYGFPAGTGEGQCVALIELGGGFRPADLDIYFSGLGVASPTVTAVSVDHGKNAPTGDANGPDGEVMLDIEVIGAIAPKATIAVYFAPNTDAGFLDAITTAVHDATRKPSIISISWGGPESAWTAQAMAAMDEAFQAAAAMGVTVCVASGDNGSGDGVSDGTDHVDFPASSPHALACGGTSLQASSTAITREVVWNGGTSGGSTGGGVSTVFALPTYQNGLKVTDSSGKLAALSMRGVPDVAGDADPATGYDVRIDGVDTVIGGTSAVAPLWAGLIARLNQISGESAGFVNPVLYQNAAAFRDITVGTNGDFSAADGWDACTGLGSPGTQLQLK